MVNTFVADQDQDQAATTESLSTDVVHTLRWHFWLAGAVSSTERASRCAYNFNIYDSWLTKWLADVPDESQRCSVVRFYLIRMPSWLAHLGVWCIDGGKVIESQPHAVVRFYRTHNERSWLGVGLEDLLHLLLRRFTVVMFYSSVGNGYYGESGAGQLKVLIDVANELWWDWSRGRIT